MFAATRVMSAGKAGLESLPYFVDELLAQGITQLEPWAADHNMEQLDQLNEVTAERRAGAWRELHGSGASDLGVLLQPETAATNLLQEINPHATDTRLADSPAQLAAWCRNSIGDACQDTYNLWEQFKHLKGIARGQQLAVVIPFCPEGPTSGTIGMYLGAALRKRFADEGKANELVVWGIELCPFINPGKMNAQEVENAFRGYVARQELLWGVPLSHDNPNDKKLYPPFDINIAIDGGATTTIHDLIDEDDIWSALDRIAAQTTACLLNGAAGGDVDESTSLLKRGKRWNAYLAHVASDLSYSSACHYLRYRVRFPWNRNPEVWDKTGPSGRREALLRRIDEDVQGMLARETDDRVKDKINYLVQLGEQIRGIKKFLIFPKNKVIREKLGEFMEEERRLYEVTCQEDETHERVTPQTPPFCVNIGLPQRLREEAIGKQRDTGNLQPIGDLLGRNGALQIRNKIEDSIRPVLKRVDYPQGSTSQADFEEIIGISVEDRSRSADNEEFRPGREFLREFITVAKQSVPGLLNALTYDLSEHVRSFESQKTENDLQPKTLGWQLPRHPDKNIPVDYSFLVLARCRRSDGFKDVSTYQVLKENYDWITAEPGRWRDYARYYGVKPPSEMEVGCDEHPERAIPEADSVPDNHQEVETNPLSYRDIIISTARENR